MIAAALDRGLHCKVALVSDEDFEPFVGGPPPDPSERTWRHPSEVAAQAQADALAELNAARGGRRSMTAWLPSSSPNVLIAGSLGAAACLTVIALFQFSFSSNEPSLAGPHNSLESGVVDEALDSASAASGLVATTTTSLLAPPSTVAVSLPEPIEVSSVVANVADNQLVGIAVGTELVATGVLADDYLITSSSAVGNQLSVSYVQQDRWALAYLVGIDPYSDLAVFRPSAESRAGRTLEALTTNVNEGSGVWTDAVPDTASAAPGDVITSITLGDEGLETATGIVLAVEHHGVTTNGQPLIGLIDTSVRRPDRLGSVLVDSSGNVVGIVVDTSSSLASAVPIHDATIIADRLNHQGWANETWIGFIGIDQADGVEVVDVTPGGPAEVAGLQPGDVIRYLDGARIDHMGGVTAGLRRAVPGDTIVVVVERAGELVGMPIQVLAYTANIADIDDQLVEPDVPVTTNGTPQAETVSEPVDE